VRDGPRGVLAINRWLSELARALLGATSASAWYAGRPVMVLRNDPMLKLFNGDIGIMLPGTQGEPLVHFAMPSGGFRALPALRLPAHETAFAMTVHKAQGSEFDDLLVLLPAQRSRVLTRELLYTALTRARRRVTLSGAAPMLTAAVSTRTERQSGLRARLRESV
jgi:exodeoxyribonuclease V alpha subunit